MNSGVVVIILIVALLFWGYVEGKFDNLLGYSNGSTVLSSSPEEEIIVTPPVPAAYPMYNVNFRYPFGVPWNVEDRRWWRRR